MNKKQEFMSYIIELESFECITIEMANFLIETIELALTEERVRDEEFLRGMEKLTEKYMKLLDKKMYN